MRLPTAVLALFLALSCAACGLSYQQRQDRFRARFITGCKVLYSPPAERASNPISLELPAISEVIERSRNELQFCYLQALELWPQLEGRIVMNFTVTPNGTVDDPTIAVHNSTILDASVGCCMARVAQTWNFPAPPDGKPFDVEYPFELVTDILRVRFSSSVVTAEPFKSRFPATIILPPALAGTSSGFQYAR